MSGLQLVEALRAVELGHRTGWLDGQPVTPNLEWADKIRQLADAFERTGGDAPLICEFPCFGMVQS